MAVGTEERIRHTTLDRLNNRTGPHAEFESVRSMKRKDSTRGQSAPGLKELLDADPVDLTLLSDEIRAYSRLNELIIWLSRALVVEPEMSVGTTEEAVIILGTDRLRAVIDTWSALQDPESSLSKTFAPLQKHLASEALWLAIVARCLGFDSLLASERRHRSAESTAFPSLPADFYGFSEMLLRDVLSLIPRLDPIFWRPTGGKTSQARHSHSKEIE